MANKHARGQPTKLTEARQAQIVLALRNGNYLEVAAQASGIDYSTLRRWQLRGEQESSGIYCDFCKVTKEAMALAEQESIGRIAQAAIGGVVVKRETITTTEPDGTTTVRVREEYTRPEWTADAWLRERSRPERWGRRDRVPLDVRTEAERIAAELGLDADEIIAEAEALAKGR